MADHPAPTLHTERLILRGFVAEDFAAHEAIMAQPKTLAFLDSEMSREDNWRRIISAVGQWIVNGYGGWMVEMDGRIVGNCGFFDAHRGLETNFDGHPEMGWIFDPSVHGKGVAGEACRAALEWADANLKRDIWAIIAPENEASHKLGAKLGFEIVGRNDYHGDVVDVLTRPFA